MTLRWQIASAVAAIVATVSVAGAVGSYLSTERQLEATADDALTTTAREVGTGPDGDTDGPPFDTDVPGIVGGCPPAGLLESAAAAQIVHPDGTVTPCLTDGVPLPMVASRPTDSTVTLDTVSVGATTYRVATVEFHEGGWLQVARDRGEAETVLRGLRLRLALLALAATAIGAVAGWLVARRIARPIVRLRDTTVSIARTQDLDTPVPAEGTGEVRGLAESFDTMVRALATSREQQRRLVDDAGHELRTPLTSLTTNAELLEAYERLPPDDRPRVLAALRADVGELTSLTDELVDLATDRSSDEPAYDIDLAELATAVAARARRRHHRSIEVVIAGEGLVTARPRMIERAIANLVDNASKYSPDETTIEVRVTPTTVEVCDRGEGIDPRDLDHVFERFYRADEARTRPGSGLGLAIVAQIVERHGGRVWARNRVHGGAAVGFSLAP